MRDCPRAGWLVMKCLADSNNLTGKLDKAHASDSGIDAHIHMSVSHALVKVNLNQIWVRSRPAG